MPSFHGCLWSTQSWFTNRCDSYIWLYCNLTHCNYQIEAASTSYLKILWICSLLPFVWLFIALTCRMGAYMNMCLRQQSGRSSTVRALVIFGFPLIWKLHGHNYYSILHSPCNIKSQNQNTIRSFNYRWACHSLHVTLPNLLTLWFVLDVFKFCKVNKKMLYCCS